MSDSPSIALDGDIASAVPETADIAAAPPAILDFSGVWQTMASSEPGADLPSDVPGNAPGMPETGQSIEALEEKLTPISFGDRAFFLSSGAEARKLAVDAIRRMHQHANRPKRRRMLVCVGPGADDGNGALPSGLENDYDIGILRTDDLGTILAEITPKTAGFLIQPARMQRDFEILPGSLLAGLREAADEYGLALAFDETFCGLGRSGMVWAHEWTGVTPDLMIVSEGLAGALPLATLIATQKIARSIGEIASVTDRGMLDPVALAAAHATIDTLLVPGFEGRVQNLAWRLEDRLAALMYKHRNLFTAQIGTGLMQGLVCTGPADSLCEKLAQQGLLARALGPVLALFPPLDTTEEDLDRAALIMAAACGEAST